MQDRLSLGDLGDQPSVCVGHVGLDDNDRAAGVQGPGDGGDRSRADVFDSIVDVPPAPSGRLRKAHAPPVLSARAMMAPPWSMPPVVHNSGRCANVARTEPGSDSTNRMPRVVASGMRSRMFSGVLFSGVLTPPLSAIGSGPSGEW